jgi:thiol-disulfide isomerase/thioredoxin
MLCGCIREDREGANIKVGDKLPDFEVVMSDGSVVSNDSLEGNVSLVMFFHTSCPDCQQALPSVQEIQRWNISFRIQKAKQEIKSKPEIAQIRALNFVIYC